MTRPARSRSTGRTTLADVAAAAGVSPITVSRALRGARSVAPELVTRVREAAERLGYQPDPAARALASARSSHVVVLVPLLTNEVFVDLLEAAQSTLLDGGYQALIGITHYDREEEERLLESFMAHRPSGLLVTGFDRSERARRLIERSGVPCVYMMEVTRAPGVYCVGFSQEEGGLAMTQHLVDGGRRRIAFCAAQLDPRTMQRAEGYRRCLRRAGLYDPGLELLNPGRSSMALGEQLFGQLMTLHPDVDAVFFNNDDLAQGALLAAWRMGIEVPRRVAVAGFNDLMASALFVPRLSSVRTPRAGIGEQAARMLMALIEDRPVPRPHLDLGFELVLRDST
jgi:LacI family gluconate utilization system Gnt-I transcriptional repressor